jgi:diguanylate cyclase (GGDEF)-like protein
VEAEVAAILCDGSIRFCIGMTGDERQQLESLASSRPTEITIGAGRLNSYWAPLGEGNLLVVGRLGDAFDIEERSLLRAMARSIELSLRMLEAISAERQARLDASYQACHDALTDLPNRRAFFRRIGDVLQDASSDQSRVALAIIDLDGFKPVNDLYGHAVGDRLLIEVARRLSDQCASDRDVFLARLGGDEFAYVVANAPKDEALVAQADQLAQSLRLPFVLPEATVKISGSIGIGVYPEMASSVEQLFERAVRPQTTEVRA